MGLRLFWAVQIVKLAGAKSPLGQVSRGGLKINGSQARGKIVSGFAEIVRGGAINRGENRCSPSVCA